MKTKEELNELKVEVETLNKKLAELSEEELKQVTGGLWGEASPGFINEDNFFYPQKNQNQYEIKIYDDGVLKEFRPKFEE